VSLNNGDDFGRAVGEGFARVVNDAQALRYSIAWFYKAKKIWPKTKEEIERFIELHQAPIDLSKYSQVNLTIAENGDLGCSYVIRYKENNKEISGVNVGSLDASVRGSFHLTRDEAFRHISPWNPADGQD
jgi:hypothetical protein